MTLSSTLQWLLMSCGEIQESISWSVLRAIASCVLLAMGSGSFHPWVPWRLSRGFPEEVSEVGTGKLGLVSGSPSEALTVGQAPSGGALGKLEPIKHLAA